MVRARGNGSIRPTGGRGRGGGRPAQITLRCPNPDCEKRYTVPARYAGRRAKCAECGAMTVIPRATRPADHAARAPERPDRTPAPRKEARRAEGVMVIPQVR